MRVDARVRITAHEDNAYNGATGTVVCVSEYGPGWWVVRLDEPRGAFGAVVVADAQLQEVS